MRTPDHDKLLVLETKVESLACAQEDATRAILDRFDILESHWTRQCDLRHDFSDKRTSKRTAKLGVVIAAAGVLISCVVSLRSCPAVYPARASQVVSK